jgi:predicted Zn-dependent protease
MRFEAQFFDGETSASHPVVVTYTAPQSFLRVVSAQGIRQVDLKDVDLLEPIGSRTGTLMIHRTGQIAIPDRQMHRELRRLLGRNTLWGWADDIENSWPLLVAGLLVVVAAVIGTAIWGIPALARSLASKVPPSIEATIGKQGLKQMVALYLSDTQLDEAMRQQVQQDFELLLQGNTLEPSSYQLHFYASQTMGANAFALPGGHIVLLDGLLDIGLESDEVVAILAHELAHVELRHGMQMLLRYAGISALLAMAVGDAASAGSLIVVIPKLLLEKGYSRNFEREADTLAVALLHRAGLPPDALGGALTKLAAHVGVDFLPTMISTHPDVSERLLIIEAASHRLLPQGGRAGADS